MELLALSAFAFAVSLLPLLAKIVLSYLRRDNNAKIVIKLNDTNINITDLDPEQIKKIFDALKDKKEA